MHLGNDMQFSLLTVEGSRTQQASVRTGFRFEEAAAFGAVLVSATGHLDSS